MAKNILTIHTGVALCMLVAFATNTAWAQNSLYSDVKAKRVGDIITVVLQENLSGSSTSDTKVNSRASGQADGSISGNFLPFEPVFGSGVSVNYDQDQQNESIQRQLLQGFVSVQIVEVTETGDLLVQGNRLTEVNGEVHEMAISGTVRQNDIDGRNQVLSYRIANANISYQKMGGLKNRKKSTGLFKKIVFGGVVAGLGAAVLLRETSN